MKSSISRLPGLYLVDHHFDVPLDYQEPSKGEKGEIKIFAREAISIDNVNRSNMPWLIFFQGGPGYHSPRPFANSGWFKRALRDFRVLLLDQRGTGRSTPVTYQTMENIETDQAKADYLKNFRADSIVKDAEFIRKELVGDEGGWYGLGQSYGGFCLTHYLSAYPESLSGCLITGGIPPVGVAVDDVYRATYKRCLKKNRQYYERYPDDEARVRTIVEFLSENLVLLPGGGRLTAERFQQLGIAFGMSDGFEQVHYLVEDAFVSVNGRKELSFGFLRGFEQLQSFETNPIYVLLHEAIYCENQASNWSAHRVREEFPQFSSEGIDGGTRVNFTGEMIYPWMLEQYDYLAPLKETANILAEFKDWPALYDQEQLRKNKVPVKALVYNDDMYVERAFSEKVADVMGNTTLWMTNEYEHNGLRQDGYRIVDRLLAMLRGEV